jgi:rubrerythrin
MPTPQDYQEEILRDQIEAMKYRQRADAARKEGKRRDAERYIESANSWDKHAEKHLRILATMIGQEGIQ